MKKLQEPAKLNHVIFIAAALAIVLGGWYTVVQAVLLDNQDVILAPTSVEMNPQGATNNGQQAFTESLGVTVTKEIRCGDTLLEVGAVVDSHMIFYNTPGDGETTDANKVWSFGSDIICVMSDSRGTDEALSSYLFKSPTTIYPGPSTGRGMESGDSYEINGSTLTVTMVDEDPGDWIRVITQSVTPNDTIPPFVSCDIGINPAGKTSKGADKGNNEGGLFSFLAVDIEDGPVEISITDVETKQVIGSVPSGSSVKHTVSKGASPLLRTANSDVDYQLRTKGSILLSATDEAGNTGTVTCK